MGILIRYAVPAAAGASFTYSIERREDRTFFDFQLQVFRQPSDIPVHAAASPLTYHDGCAAANFDSVEDGKTYIVRIHHAGLGGKTIVKVPVTAWNADNPGATSKGEPHVEPHFRGGKKFLNNKVIEAKHRLTFYGDDGFTIHTATLWEDGTSSCNCPSWVKKPKYGERSCKHSKRVMELTSNVDETGERPDPAPPEVPRATNPFQRRSRSVDT